MSSLDTPDASLPGEIVADSRRLHFGADVAAHQKDSRRLRGFFKRGTAGMQRGSDKDLDPAAPEVRQRISAYTLAGGPAPARLADFEPR